MAINYFDSKTIKDIRTSSGLSQEDFWRQYGVTQSAGSRYEKSRVPEEFAILNYLVYAKELDIQALRKEMLAGPELKLKKLARKITEQ